MRQILKVSLSFLITLILSAAFLLVAFSGLFDLIETSFFQPRIQQQYQRYLSYVSAKIKDYHRTNINKFLPVIKNPAVFRAYLSQQSAEDIFTRTNLFGKLREEFVDLRFVRLISKDGKKIHFSTLRSDIKKRETYRIVYYNFNEVEKDFSGKEIVCPENKKYKLIIDSKGKMFIYSFPVFDNYDIYRGSALFYVSKMGLENYLFNIPELRFNDLALISSKKEVGLGGVLINFPQDKVRLISNDILNVWDRYRGNKSYIVPFSLKRKNGGEERYFFFFQSNDNLGDVGILVPKSKFSIQLWMKIILSASFFITVFLLIFLILNLRQDPMVILSERIKRFQIEFLREYVSSKEKLDWEKWRRELVLKQGEVKEQIKKGIGRISKDKEKEVDELIDKSWEEIINIIGRRIETPAQVEEKIDLRKIEEVIQKALSSGRFVVPTVVAGGGIKAGEGIATAKSEIEKHSVGAPPGIEGEGESVEVATEGLKPVEVEELDEEEVEELEEAEEVEGVSPVEELEEVEEVEELEEVEEIPPAEEPEEVEAVEEAEETEEAEELEELEEVVSQIEELEEVEEIPPAEEPEEVEAVEEAEGAEEVEELEEAEEVEGVSPVEELEEVEEVEELEEVEEIPPAEEAEAVEAVEEAEETEEAEEVEETEEEGRNEELEELESVPEIETLPPEPLETGIEELPSVGDEEGGEGKNVSGEIEEINRREGKGRGEMENKKFGENEPSKEEPENVEELEAPEELTEGEEEVEELEELEEVEEIEGIEDLTPEENEQKAELKRSWVLEDEEKELSEYIENGSIVKYSIEEFSELVKDIKHSIVLEDGVYKIREDMFEETPEEKSEGSKEENTEENELTIGSLFGDEEGTEDIFKDVKEEIEERREEFTSQLKKEKFFPLTDKGLNYDEYLKYYSVSINSSALIKSFVDTSRRANAIGIATLVKEKNLYKVDIKIGFEDRIFDILKIDNEEPFGRLFLRDRNFVFVNKPVREIKALKIKFPSIDFPFIAGLAFLPLIYKNEEGYLVLAFSKGKVLDAKGLIEALNIV